MASRIIAGLRAGQLQFRIWRRGRPFWGGLLLIIAGLEILIIPTAQQLILPIDMVIYAGIAGVSGYLIGGLLAVVGILAWLQPQQNTFFGIVATLLALASFVTSNFGGFVIGMLLGLVGGALVFAWSSDKPARVASSDGRRAPWHRYLPRRRAGGRASADRKDDESPTEVDADADATAATDAAKTATSNDTSPEHPGDRNGYHVMLAVPLAALLLTAPAEQSNWWDWLTPGDSGDSGDSSEQDDTEPSPESPAPTPSPSAELEDDELPEGGITPEDGADDEDEDEDGADDEDDDADPAECTLALGGDAVAEDEDELAEAVEACQAAEEQGELPEVPQGTSDGCFTPTVSPTGMEADRLTMRGARFEGVVECATSEGSERYLRLSMDEADFTGADLWFESRGARSTMALPDMQMQGEVVLHVTRMHVRLLGIPLTFTPDFPPPLLLPIMSVTELEVDQPLAEAAQLSVGGLEQDFRDQS